MQAAYVHSHAIDIPAHDVANKLSKPPPMGKGLAHEIFVALSEQTVIVRGTNAATIVLPRLAHQLAALRRQRDEDAQEVEQLVQVHPLYSVLTSTPGVGASTAARLLTEVAAKAFASAAHLAAYAGLAPVTRRSCSSIHGEHPSRRGNKVFKRALSCRPLPCSGTQCRRLTVPERSAKEKRHNQALIALDRRRCAVMYAMRRDGTLYCPAPLATA